MKTALWVFLVMFLAVAAYAGVRVETQFNSFQVCIVPDVTGAGQNKVLVSGEIGLDNGGRSRIIGYDIYPLLSPGQRTQLRNDVLDVMRAVSIREDVPTPVPTPTPTFTSGGGQPTPTPTKTATPTLTKTNTPIPTATP